MAETIHDLIILGSGPAGLTAGIYAARSNLKPLIIDGLNPGGQLMGTTAVENWPGEKSILGPSLMQKMREHAEHTGCSFKSGEIISTDFNQNPFVLTTNKNEIIKARSIIVATGATPKRLKVPGEDTYWGRGVTTCATCDGAFYQNRPVVIVGGGDTAMEDASFMLRYTNDITIVQIEDKLSASAVMQQRVLNKPEVKIIYNSTITNIIGDEKGIKKVSIRNLKTKEEQDLKTNAVFVAIGLRPNTAPFKGQLALKDNGYLIVTKHTHTSVAGVFAAGDVQDYRYRQAITSAGAGCMAALDAQRFLEE